MTNATDDQEKREVVKFFADFLWVDPAASRSEVAEALLPPGDEPATTWPCRIVTERRRVLDQSSGKRVTQDWRIGHFLLWVDGDGAPVMGRAELRSILLDAKASRLDEIVVYGSVALISARNLAFRQFGVRKMSEIAIAEARQ